MCLDQIYRGKQKREALAKLPESGYYWKVIETELDDRYYPPCWGNKPYKIGWNKTSKICRIGGYDLAYHIFRSQKSALSYRKIFSPKSRMPYLKVIRCKVEKKDIINIGTQNKGLCIVTTRFWCPKPKGVKK